MVGFNTFETGRLGVDQVRFKLRLMKIKHCQTEPEFSFDIYTEDHLGIEVKYANFSEETKRGKKYKRFTFRISKEQRKHAHILVLVCNTDYGHWFYVIPMREVTANTIGFNPFSQQRSKYEKYKDCWDLVFSDEMRLQKARKEVAILEDIIAQVEEITKIVQQLDIGQPEIAVLQKPAGTPQKLAVFSGDM